MTALALSFRRRHWLAPRNSGDELTEGLSSKIGLCADCIAGRLRWWLLRLLGLNGRRGIWVDLHHNSSNETACNDANRMPIAKPQQYNLRGKTPPKRTATSSLPEADFAHSLRLGRPALIQQTPAILCDVPKCYRGV